MLYSTALAPPSSRYHATIPMFSAALHIQAECIMQQVGAAVNPSRPFAAVAHPSSRYQTITYMLSAALHIHAHASNAAYWSSCIFTMPVCRSLAYPSSSYRNTTAI